MASGKANRSRERSAERAAFLRLHGDVLLQALTDPICVLDHLGFLLEASDSFCQLLETPRAELLGMHASTWDNRIPPPQKSGTDFPEGRLSALFRRRDASLVPVEAEYACMKLEEDCFIHLSAHPASGSLLRSDASFLFENNAAGILLIDQDARIRKGNPAFWRITGYSPGEISGLSFQLLFDPPEIFRDFLPLLHNVLLGKQVRATLRLRRKDGTTLWAETTGSPAPMEDRRDGAMLVLLDLTDLHESREKMERQLSEDPLTSLPNRHGLETALSGALARAKRKGTVFAVCALDIDDFRPINDRLGAPKGDSILGELAKRLRQQVRGSDFVARIGGDEFGLVIEDLSIEKTTSQLTHVLNRIHQAIERPFFSGEKEEIRIGISMGIALFPSNGDDGETLVRQADAALYQAKSSKGARSQWWSFGASLPALPAPESSFDAYGADTKELLRRHQSHIETVIVEFVEAFFAQIEQDPEQKSLLQDQDEGELQNIASLQAKHLRFLLSGDTTRDMIIEMARKTGKAHALIGVNGAMLTQSMALYRRLLSDHLTHTFLTARDRYRLLLANEIRLQDDLQEELRAGIEVSGEYFSVLSAPLPPQGALWADIRRTEVDLLGSLPAIACVFLMRLNSNGTFIVEDSAGPKGQEGAAILRNPQFEAVVDPDSPRGKGLIAYSWRSLSPQKISNYQKDPRVAHWRDVVRPLDIRSGAAIPIRNPDGTAVAVLSLYGSYPNQFDTPWSVQFVRGLTQRWEKIWELCRAPASVIPEDQAATYRHELFSGGLSMYMQPVFDLTTGGPVKVEALARLVRPSGEVIPPAYFLPSLGDAELDRLFRAGLDLALQWIPRWDASHLHLDISINLPPGTLRDPDCPKWVEEALHRHGVEPNRLTLELLENREMELKSQDEAIERLIRLGVRLAMDDLGSGFSSLQRLATLPFDNIKVDQGLLKRIHVAPLHTLSMIGTIIRMGQDFERVVIVEGLEDLAMVEATRILGATFGQGYALGRPMPADQILEWSQSVPPFPSPTSITTFLGALSYHRWIHTPFSAPGSPDIAHCPLTPFLSRVANEDPRILRAHEGFHKDTSNDASGRDLTDWLVERIREDGKPQSVPAH